MMRFTRGGGGGRLFVSSAIFVIALGAAAATAPAQRATAPAMAVSHPLSLDAQNRLVAEHCAGCHDDEVKTGGLTLEHFDAAQIEMTVDRRHQQRACLVALAHLIDVGAGGEQCLRRVDVALPRRKEQRREAALRRNQRGAPEELWPTLAASAEAASAPAGRRGRIGCGHAHALLRQLRAKGFLGGLVNVALT